jgi:cytochrome c5
MNRSSAAWLAISLLTAAAWAGTGAQLPEGEGKGIVEAACASCHGLDVLAGKQWDRERWQTVVAAMVDRGASLKTAEADQVAAYLAKNFGGDEGRSGAKNRGRKLVEDICSLCHEWQRVKSQELTKEQWSGVIKGMISEGAPVTDEEFDLIVEYLAKNYGPKD